MADVGPKEPDPQIWPNKVEEEIGDTESTGPDGCRYLFTTF